MCEHLCGSSLRGKSLLHLACECSYNVLLLGIIYTEHLMSYIAAGKTPAVESAHKICLTPSQNLLSLKMRQANGTLAMDWGWRFPEGAPVKHFFSYAAPLGLFDLKH
jgi:hypothetical protein